MTERGDMDTKDFDARNEEKSRSVCERIHAEHAGRELTERERRILDMWPKFEDGAPLMYEDEFQLGGEAHTAYWFNFGVYGRVSIGVEQGSHVRLPNGVRVKRPGQSVLDADGVEIRVGDTVWHHSGFAHGVVTSIDAGSLMGTVRYVNGGVEFRDAAKDLTHTRLDSWERLEEDALKGVCEYAGAEPGEFDAHDCDACRFYDERSKLMCRQQMALDIIRRAEALAGVEVDAGR